MLCYAFNLLMAFDCLLLKGLLTYLLSTLQWCHPLPSLGHIWDVMLVWRKENITKTVSVLHSIVYYYNGAQRYEQFLQVGRLCRALIWLGLAHPSASVSSIFMVLYIVIFFVTFFLYLLVNWAWWEWPFTWLTNHCHSELWNCWLGHTTRKIVSEMTYNELSGTLNPILYHGDAGHLAGISSSR